MSPSLFVYGAALLAIRALDVWRTCHDAASHWKLRSAIPFVLALLVFDLIISAVLFWGLSALLVQSKLPVPVALILSVMGGFGGAAATRRASPQPLRQFAAFAKLVKASGKSFQDFTVERIRDRCLCAASDWVDTVAAPTLQNYDIEPIALSMKRYVANAPGSTPQQRTVDAKFIEDRLCTGGDPTHDTIAIVCHRMLHRGGRRHLEKLVRRAQPKSRRKVRVKAAQSGA